MKAKIKKITSVNLNVNEITMCTDIPEYIMAEENRHATQEDDHLNALTVYMINSWLSTRAEVKEKIQPYMPF